MQNRAAHIRSAEFYIEGPGARVGEGLAPADRRGERVYSLRPVTGRTQSSLKTEILLVGRPELTFFGLYWALAIQLSPERTRDSVFISGRGRDPLSRNNQPSQPWCPPGRGERELKRAGSAGCPTTNLLDPGSRARAGRERYGKCCSEPISGTEGRPPVL